VTIEQGGARREVALPPLQLPAVGGKPPAPGFTREGNTLTAPTAASAPPAAPARPPAGRPPAVPPAQVPQVQMPQVQVPQVQAPQPQVQPQTAAPADDDDSAADSPVAPARRSARNRNLVQ
jgi:hypothetical protein